MKSKKLFAVSIGLLAFLSFNSGNQAAYAQFGSMNQTQLVSDLNAERVRIENNLTASKNNGQIDAQQASQLQAELSSIASQLDSLANSGGLSPNQASNISSALRNVESRIRPGGFGLGRSFGNDRRAPINQTQAFSDLNAERLRIENEITTATTSGQISASTSSRLKSQVNHIAAQLDHYNRNGGIRASQARSISHALSRVSSKLQDSHRSSRYGRRDF